jgi:hypothetical protein
VDSYDSRLAESMFKSEAPLIAYAMHMLEYFEGCIRLAPSEPHWARGAAITRRWLGLLAAPGTVSQNDLDRLLADMRLGGWCFSLPIPSQLV